MTPASYPSHRRHKCPLHSTRPLNDFALHPPLVTMSEFELEKKKQDKRDRKEFKETLVAVGEEDEPLVGRLMATGSNPDAVEDAKHPSGVKGMKDGWSALLLALMRKNLIIARELLAAGATVDMVMGKDRMTVLMYAAGNNWLDAVRLLFEFNANPNVVDKRGCTALYCAAQKGHAAMTRLIVEHGADLNVQDCRRIHGPPRRC